MLNQRVEQWDEKLNALLRRVDLKLEALYGTLLPPHPARPEHGSTTNPQHDGLFRVTATFTPGFGSTFGRGYVIQLEMVTLKSLPKKQTDIIEQKGIQLIQEGLDEVHPGKNSESRVTETSGRSSATCPCSGESRACLKPSQCHP